MLDGELEGSELTDTIEHIGKCPACMKQLKVFQMLQEKIGSDFVQEAPPRHVWDKIQRSENKPRRSTVIPLHPAVTGILAVAAGVILIFILSILLEKTDIPFQPTNTPMMLTGHSGSMSEERFVSLTRELLSAESIYHRKMYLILSTLYNEGSLAEDNRPTESDQGLELKPVPGKVDSTGKVWF